MIEFAKLRKDIPIERILAWQGVVLKPTGKTLRGQCLLCNHKSERDFVVTPEKGLWFCFNCRRGGDGIQLVALIENVGVQDAARLIVTHFKGP